MTEDQKYYVAVLFSRLHHVAAIFVVVTVASVIYVFNVTPTYEAGATLMLEAPQIQTGPATSGNNSSSLEQLQVLEKRLLTRKNLLDIEQNLHVLPSTAKMQPDDIVKAMQRLTTITIDTGLNQIALLSIRFSADQAQKAADGVNEFVKRALAYNLSARTSQAQGTVQFFTQEVDRLHRELAAQSSKILAFQNANTDALPSTLDTRLQQQTSLQQRLPQIDGQIATLRAQKQQRIDLLGASGQSASPATLTPEEKLLDQAEADLADALAVYAPTSAKVKMIKDRIIQLKSAIKAQDNAPVSDTKSASLARLTSDLDMQIKQLEQQRDAAQKELSSLTASINRTPQVEVRLSTLKQEFANIQNQYKAATDQLSNASAAARIDALSKGQRIVVLDPATVPDRPTKPKRTRIVLFGATAGLILGLCFVALQDILNPSVRRPVELERKFGITPLVAIPYTKTPGERLRHHLVLISFLLMLVLGLPTLLVSSAAHYKPLADLLQKVGTKIGL